MNWTTLHARVLPSLFEGTSRRPLPGELTSRNSDDALAMLSLTGQALRFERPSTPKSLTIEPQIKDDRKIIADPLRRPLVRLLTARTATEHPARAVARAFEQFRLRPHPFDLPSIDAFVRSYAEKLGPTAQQWVSRQKPDAERHNYFDAELLDESNWTQATPSRRVTYLEQRRQEDPDAARVLVESTWTQEDADTRFRLLQAFQTRLSPTDQPFLSSLEKDRAPRVRALAARFLARLDPGVRNPALDACLQRIQRSHTGLLRKRAALQMELPANINDQSAPRWILQTFSEISIGELAAAFEIAEKELIEAAAKDEHLLLALSFLATSERRLGLLELVVERLHNAWERMSEAALDTMGTMTDAERRRWQEIIVHPYRKDPPATYPLWDWLHRIADREAPPSVMSMVLDPEFLAKALENEYSRAPWLEVLASMCPSSQRQELRAQLAHLDPSQTFSALTLLEILDGMENAHTHV